MQLWGEEYTGGDEHANYVEASKEEARNASSNFKGKNNKNRVEANDEATYEVRSKQDQGKHEKDGEVKRKTRDGKKS